MREINASQITDTIAELAREAAFFLPDDFRKRLEEMGENEKSEVGKLVISQLLENADIASGELAPMCQDTGMAVVFVEWGQECHLVGGTLQDAVDEGVRRTYKDSYLRKSIYANPYKRDKNTGDNTPAFIHTKLVAGDKVKIIFAAKGGGSENMSTVRMMKPSDGIEGVKKFVQEWVKQDQFQ